MKKENKITVIILVLIVAVDLAFAIPTLTSTNQTNEALEKVQIADIAGLEMLGSSYSNIIY